MKQSRRNIAKATMPKLGKPPVISKYAAKVRGLEKTDENRI